MLEHLDLDALSKELFLEVGNLALELVNFVVGGV